MDGHRVRTIGLARATVKIGMLNLAYNMKRLVQLSSATARHCFKVHINDGIGAPIIV
jgi:transposase, IS5 family